MQLDSHRAVDVDRLAIDTIRTLAMDAVQAAGSGHDEVLPSHVAARVAVEQASTFGWERYVGLAGRVIGMDTFGASAPLKDLQQKFGFTVDAVVDAARETLNGKAIQ